MRDIKKVFLTKTIKDFSSSEFDMPYIKFVFDREDLKELYEHIDSKEKDTYYDGLKSMKSLCDILKEYEEGKDNIYIKIHDSKKFFSYLEQIIETYQNKFNVTIGDPESFISSIWLRMGVSDIENVEEFLERQLQFLKNESLIPDSKIIQTFDNQKYLYFQVNENDDWFETNKNIVFTISKPVEIPFEEGINYKFPAIHFGLSKENNIPTCFIYGVQYLDNSRSEEIKEELQPIRKGLRNKNVSADFIIALSLFLDYLYSIGIKDIEIPTLQVFNYPYHENLSNSIKKGINRYTEEEQKNIEQAIDEGEYSSSMLDYLHTKIMANKFVDKQDMISHNKTERLIELFQELIEKNPNIELLSEPFLEGENMIIHLNGTTNILKDYAKKERTY